MPLVWENPLLWRCSGVSSLSAAMGEVSFSGPEEKSISMDLCGVVKDEFRNGTGGFIEGVEGKRNV